MNIEKTVRKALFSEPKKVELSAEKVELGIVQDIEKLKTKLKGNIKEMIAIEGEANSERSKAFNTIRKAVEEAKKVEEKLSRKFVQYKNATLEAEILFNDAKKAAKELGVDFNSVQGVQDLQKMVSTYDDYAEEIETDVKNITFKLPNI